MSFRDRAIALLLLGAAILFFARERIYNSVAGPFDVEAGTLAVMDSMPAHRFVRVVRHGHALRFNELAGAAFHEEEVHQVTGARRETASFRYLDEAGHRLLVRNADLAETGDSEVIGLVSPMGDSQLQTEAPGEVLFLDCNKTGYRIGALLLLAAGIVAIGLGIDQARRARKTVS